MTNSVACAVLLMATVIASDPFFVLAPCVSLSSRDRRALANGDIVGRTLSAHDVLLDRVNLYLAEGLDAVPPITQMFSSRYMNGGFAITAVTTDTDTGEHYLIYFNRSRPDLLGGFFGPIKRNVLESRLSDELPEIILKLRSRLEGT